jgi:hypothetical protein
MDFNLKAGGNDDPVLTVRDVARYRTLLLAKRDELAAAMEEAGSLVPPANDNSCDLVDWARADTEAELHILRRGSEAQVPPRVQTQVEWFAVQFDYF